MVVGVGLVFTTYTMDLYEFEVRTECPEVRIELGRCYYKSKDGKRRHELNLYKFYYARSHTRCYRVTISIVLKVGDPFIPLVTVLFAWLTATAPNLCMTK